MAEWLIKTAKATIACAFTPPLVPSQWAEGRIAAECVEFRWEPSLNCFFLRTKGSRLERSLHLRTVEFACEAASLEAEVNISMTGKPPGAITAELRPGGFCAASQILKTGPKLIAVRAPLSGKVLKVQKLLGEMVQKGEVLAIIEAMKMENSVLAPQSGKVCSVSCQVGDTVQAKSALFSMEAG